MPSNTRFTSLFGQKVFDETYLKNNPQVYKKLSSLVVGQKLTKDDAFAQLFERVHYILARSPDIVKAYPEADQKYILNFLQDRLRGYYGLNNGSIAVGDFDEYAEFNAYERLLENSSPDLKNKMMTPEMIRAERRELVYNQFFKNPDDLLGRLEFKEMLEGMFFDPSFVEKHPEFYSKLLELADKSNRTILDLKELLNGTNKALLDNPETLQKLPEKLRNDMLDFYEKRLSGYVKYVDKKLVVKDINYSEELRLYENLYKNSSPTMKKTVLSYQEVKNKLHTSLDEILKNVPSPQERTALFKDSIELFDPEQKIKIYEMVFLGDADYIASQITDWPHPWDNYFRMLKGDKSPDVLVDFIKEFEMMMGKISSMDEVYKGKYALPDYKYINRFYSEMYTSLPETHRQLVTLPEDFAQGLRRSIAKVMISKQGIKDASRLQESLRVYLSTAPSKIELLTDFYPTVLKASGGNAEVKKNALTPISQLYREISVDQFTNLPNAKKEEFVKSIKFLRDSALADDGLSGFLTSFVPSTDDWSKKFGDDFNKILNAQISAPSPSDCVTPILKSILN